MKGPLRIADLREVDQMYQNDEISYSRMVEILNERVQEHYDEKIAKIIDALWSEYNICYQIASYEETDVFVGRASATEEAIDIIEEIWGDK